MEWKTCLSFLVEHQSSCNKERRALYIGKTFNQLAAEETDSKICQKQLLSRYLLRVYIKRSKKDFFCNTQTFNPVNSCLPQ